MRQERQVAVKRLAADGLRLSEIAIKLRVSRKTVEYDLIVLRRQEVRV